MACGPGLRHTQAETLFGEEALGAEVDSWRRRNSHYCLAPEWNSWDTITRLARQYHFLRRVLLTQRHHEFMPNSLVASLQRRQQLLGILH